MSRLMRGLLALFCLAVLTWSVNLVAVVDPSNQPARLEAAANPDSGLTESDVDGVVETLPAADASPTNTLTASSNAIIREHPQSGSDGFPYVVDTNVGTLIAAALRPGSPRGDGPTLTSMGPVRPPRTTTTLRPPQTTTTVGPPSTTTTVAPPATTTTFGPPATTSTTRPSPTTTAAPATTTTSGRVIPATIAHPGISGDNGYIIGLTARDPERGLWRAPYLYDVPYAANTGWLAGDRVGYGCAYGFLHQDGEIVGRFTFRRIEGASYIVVNDTYMDEGARYYNGAPTPPGTSQVPDFECPVSTESYETTTAPDERPVVVFWSGAGQALEIRDYRGTVAGPGITFEVVDVITQPFQVTSAASGTHTVNSRVTVVARENGVPVVVIYYDGLGTGQVTK